MGKCCCASPRGAVSNVRASSRYCGNLTLPVTSSPSTANCWLAHLSPSLTVSCPNTLVGVVAPGAISSLLGCDCRPAGHSGNAAGGLHYLEICVSNGLIFKGSQLSPEAPCQGALYQLRQQQTGFHVRRCRKELHVQHGATTIWSRLPSKVGLSKYEERCHCSLKLKQAVRS